VSRIVVTGIGIITSIGKSAEENRTSLLKSAHGLSSIELFSTRYASLLPFGEIKISNEDLKSQFKVQQNPGITRTSLLALHAIREAIQDSHLANSEIQSIDTAFINGTTVGGMCLTEELHQDANRKVNGSAYVNSYDLGSVGIFIRSHYNIQGIINTINTACSSSANAIMYGTRLIKSGLAKRAIVGGVDSLAKFTINGFNSLQILSPDKCAPFDENRKGLNLGEGAAFLVLEKEEDCKNKNIYASLSGYSNTNDAFHPSSLSDNGEGPYLAMKSALEIAGLTPGKIDFINAHGTATENNDMAESKAMKRLFDTVPLFASTKTYTGHTLGAASAIEAIYSIFNIHHQEIYPSLNFERPIPDIGLIPVQNYQKKSIQHVMSNSFGFGGNCSSLIFSKP
jgi:3-oxoacyl-(acyl-carrier-protein) synthase